MAFEITAPTNPPLTGELSATLLDANGVTPSNIIRVTDDWSVKFDWSITGAIASCLCGTWCLHVHLESIGEGPEVTLPGSGAPAATIPMKPCEDGGVYDYEFKVRSGLVTAESCGHVYRLVATVTYRDPCGDPGPMAGFADLGLVQFYEPGKGA